MTSATGRGERGSITVFVVGMVVALVVMAGLVFDGGRIIAGHREADAEASGAARAAAQALAVSVRRSGAVAIDAAAGRLAAGRYLAVYGHVGDVAVDGDRVTVTVRFAEQSQILGIVGLRSRTVTGTASAIAVPGGPGGVGP